MLLIFEKGIRGGRCHAIRRCAKANNKYIQNYDKDIECNSIECKSVEYNSIECKSIGCSSVES